MLIFTHTVQTHRLRNNNPKPHFSSREGILNSRCCRFAQSFAAMIAVVAAHVVAGDRSIDHDRRIQQTLARDSVFAIAFVCFSRIKKLLGRTETRTHERM